MRIIIFILTLTPILIFSNKINKTVMVKIISESKIKKIDIEMLNSSLEMNLTKLNYGIISQDIQEEALKEQQNQRKSDCYDDGCLVDTGRMLAARELLVLNITKRKKDYFIKARRLDIETGVVKKSDITIIKKNYDDETAHKKLSEMINILFNDEYIPSNNTKGNNLLIKEDDIIDLLIDTSPSNAIIILNDKKIGDSPINERILKGKLKLEIRKEFYQTIKKTIDTFKETNFSFDLKLKPNYKIVHIETNKDALIKIAGEVYNKDTRNILKKGRHKIEVEIQNKNERGFYQKIEEEINISEKTDFIYKLELKPEYTYLTLNINQDNNIIKLNEEIIKESVVNNKIIKKGKYKLKIEKKHYKTIEEEIDIKGKTSLSYKLTPITYTKNIVSSNPLHKNVVLYDLNANKHVTPFKVEVTVNNPQEFVFKETGFKGESLTVSVDSDKLQIIPIRKLRMHKLTINNKIGLNDLSIKGKGENGDIDIKLPKGINKINLYKGNYTIEGEKRYYKSYYENIYVKNDGVSHYNNSKNNYIKTLKIKPKRDYDYSFEPPFNLISEYTFSKQTSHNTSVGLGVDASYGREKTFSASFFSIGLLGDFYNKSVTLKFALFKLLFYENGPIFVQLGFYGLGDEIDFLFKDDNIYMSGLISFKIGGDIYLSYPSLKLRIYLKVASLTDTSIDRAEDDIEIDGITFTVGTRFIWGKMRR